MLIAGAKGFAMQLTDVLLQIDPNPELCYFDDKSADLPEKFLNRFPIIKTLEEAKDYFKNRSKYFALGTGNPSLRKMFYETFNEMGGQVQTIISPKATVGTFDVHAGAGSIILTGSVIESTVHLGIGCLINLHCTVTHNSTIGDFCELSPGVHISGGCEIGNHCFLGTGSVLLPKIKIGNHVTVGAGAVVTKDIPDFQTVTGVPANILTKKKA